MSIDCTFRDWVRIRVSVRVSVRVNSYNAVRLVLGFG